MTPLFEQLAGLFAPAEIYIWQAASVFTRMSGLAMMLPALGEKSLPMRIKLSVALLMTLIVASALPPQSVPQTHILREAAIGLFLGSSLRLAVLALQIAGSIAGQSVSLAQMFNGAGPEAQPAMANLLGFCGMVLFLSLGGLDWTVAVLLHSYRVFPIGQMPHAGDMAQWVIRASAGAIAFGFQLAAPFVLGGFFYNVALGAISKAMPGLMVTFIGAPALSLGGLVLLALAAPHLLAFWQASLLELLGQPFVEGAFGQRG